VYGDACVDTSSSLCGSARVYTTCIFCQYQTSHCNCFHVVFPCIESDPHDSPGFTLYCFMICVHRLPRSDGASSEVAGFCTFDCTLSGTIAKGLAAIHAPATTSQSRIFHFCCSGTVRLPQDCPIFTSYSCIHCTHCGMLDGVFSGVIGTFSTVRSVERTHTTNEHESCLCYLVAWLLAGKLLLVLLVQ
jgi:hypothetical protein